MTNLETARSLLATLRQALYQYDDHLAATLSHVEDLLDNPNFDPCVTADEDAADPVG